MLGKEWRVEVLWRMDADMLPNEIIERVADEAEANDWLVSRWELGAGMYIAGYLQAITRAEAADTLYQQVGKWMTGLNVPGHLASVEALTLAEAGFNG